MTSADTWCPKCDRILEANGTHALTCAAGGDRVLRHNPLRKYLHDFIRRAGLRVEVEESGLLPDDPLRRPGDLFLPSWPAGTPTALDFAVTSPQHLDPQLQQEAAKKCLAAAKAYEKKKFEDRNTQDKCAREGITLVPLIAETLGGWGPMATDFFRRLVHWCRANQASHREIQKTYFSQKSMKNAIHKCKCFACQK